MGLKINKSSMDSLYWTSWSVAKWVKQYNLRKNVQSNYYLYCPKAWWYHGVTGISGKETRLTNRKVKWKWWQVTGWYANWGNSGILIRLFDAEKDIKDRNHKETINSIKDTIIRQ